MLFYRGGQDLPILYTWMLSRTFAGGCSTRAIAISLDLVAREYSKPAFRIPKRDPQPIRLFGVLCLLGARGQRVVQLFPLRTSAALPSNHLSSASESRSARRAGGITRVR